MNIEDLELHDALLNLCEIDYVNKTVSLDICFFESEIAKNRVSAKLVFRNTSSISQVADLQNMEKNAFAGNINHWIIGDRASPTFIYLNDGCLSIKADKPEIQSLL